MKTNDAAGGLQAARHVDAERNPPLPAYASRLARDLGRAVAGEVDFGAQARALYAGRAELWPSVRPRAGAGVAELKRSGTRGWKMYPGKLVDPCPSTATCGSAPGYQPPAVGTKWE